MWTKWKYIPFEWREDFLNDETIDDYSDFSSLQQNSCIYRTDIGNCWRVVVRDFLTHELCKCENHKWNIRGFPVYDRAKFGAYSRSPMTFPVDFPSKLNSNPSFTAVAEGMEHKFGWSSNIQPFHMFWVFFYYLNLLKRVLWRLWKLSSPSRISLKTIQK